MRSVIEKLNFAAFYRVLRTDDGQVAAGDQLLEELRTVLQLLDGLHYVCADCLAKSHILWFANQGFERRANRVDNRPQVG